MLKDKKRPRVYVCGRSLGSFPVYPLQHPHTERENIACAPQTHKKKKAFVSLSLLPCFLFSLFPLSDTCRPSSTRFLFISTHSSIVLTANHVELGTNQNSSVDCHCSWWPCQEGLVFQITRPIRYALTTTTTFIPIELIVSMIAVVTVDGEQTHTTTVMKKTLNPYWNESFDL